MGATSTLAINSSLYQGLWYTPVKDFVAISGVTNIPMFLVVNPTMGVKSSDQLIALAKSKPGHINYASAGTPAAVVTRLNAEITRAMNNREMKEALHTVGGQLITSSPQQFATFLQGETEKWSKLVKASGAKID